MPLNFEDTWRAVLGFNYKLKKAWTLRLGTAYDKTPAQDAYRTPRLSDQDRIWAANGFQYRLGKAGAFDVGYPHLFDDDGVSMLPNQANAGSGTELPSRVEPDLGGVTTRMGLIASGLQVGNVG